MPAAAPSAGSPSPARLAALRRGAARLRAWFRRSARDLPWRRTRDPYAIWVSEVMLQQTQVTTVIPYYERWLRALPDVAALAAAEETAVLKLWEGLGYYRRARNLQAAARVVMDRHGGRIPRDPDAFRALPGVGDYTAAAVLSIAFGARLACVDGNVRRVLARLEAIDGDTRAGAGARYIDALAAALMGRAEPGLHNEAMMELGALVCTPREPACGRCPLATCCVARLEGDPERYPAPPPRREVPRRDLVVGLVRRGDALLVVRRPADGMLAGLWDLPAVPRPDGAGDEAAAEALRRALRDQHGVGARVGEPLSPVRHLYTHLHVTLHPLICEALCAGAAAEPSPDRAWATPERLAALPLAGAAHKVLARARVHLPEGGDP